MRRRVLSGRVRARRDARGAATVEFALILPVLMLIVCGIINYGDMLSVRQSVSQAASEGARAAAVAQTDPALAGKAAVDNALKAQGQKCTTGGCTVTIAPCTNDATKSCATVVVKIGYDGLIPGFGVVLPKELTYTAVARVS